MANKPYVVGIDPGNERSAFCLVSPDLRPLAFDKCRNRLTKQEQKELIESTGREDISREIFFDAMCDALLEHMVFFNDGNDANVHFVIEGIENFGMPAGRSLFDTAEYIGRLSQMIEEKFDVEPFKVYRHEEKMTICHNPRANDATIKRALVDRFAPNTPNYGKGSKKQKGFFYGFSADCWSAFAQAVTYHDKYLVEGVPNKETKREDILEEICADDLPF